MRYFTFFLLLFMLTSCEKGSEFVQNFEIGYSYFPILEEGTMYTYEVESSVYSNNGLDVEQRKYFRREEVVVSEMFDSEKGSTRLDVFTSQTGNEPWQYLGAQIIERNELQGITTNIHDERVISLSFPIQDSKKWDGLSLLGDNFSRSIFGEMLTFYDGWSFKIDQIDGLYESYSNVLVVSQADSENAINKRYSVEKYAQNVGLVYKEQIILDTQCISECEGQSWEEKGQSGIIMTKKLIAVE